MGGSKFLSTLKKAAQVAGDVLSTKGDLLSRSASALGRLPVSTNNFSLLCDSAQTLGIKWGASATSTLTAAGDLLYASGANTLARLAKGDDNQVLKMNGSSLNWETLPAGGATVTRQTAELSSAFTTSSTSFVNITGITLSIPDNTGSFFAGLSSESENDGNGNYNIYVFKDASTQVHGVSNALPSANIHDGMAMNYAGLNDGQTLLAQVRVTAGTAILNDDTEVTTRLSTLEVS